MSENVINLKDGVKETPSTHWLLIESYVDKKLVPLLRRLRDNGWKLDAISKEEFSNELMHEYANRVMANLKNVSSILIAKDYVVLDYEVTQFKQGDYESTRYTHIVLGLDENNKVWLREVNDICSSTTCESYNDIAICLTTNNSVRKCLGYDYEVPSNNVIGDVGTYRVQGDLIMDVEIIDIGEIVNWYMPSIYTLARWKCVDRFYGELIKHGIDPDVRDVFRNLEEPTLRIRLMKKQDERSKPEPVIQRRVEDEYFYELRDYVVKALSNGSTWAYPVSIGNIALGCHVFPARIDVNYQTVTMGITFNVEDNYYLRWEVEKLLMNHIINDTGNYVYKLGRHEIEALNVSNPITTFNFPDSWVEDIQYLKPLPVDLVLKPSDYPRIAFIVNRDSKLVLKHPEHGEVTIGFDGLYMVEVRTQNKVSTFVGLMNEIAIDRVKQMNKQGGGNQ